MLFNTWTFAWFFGAVYGLYLLLGHRGQNRLLLVASYVFYGWWDYRFLSLILISTIVDYLCGIKIAEARAPRRRRLLLATSVVTNLSILGLFKYFNFFAESLEAAFAAGGWSVDPLYLNIILPVGISFYTFQTMSYTIDIYRGEMEPTRSFFDFALFVAFFPQLVAGPIERARRLLPQILTPRKVTVAGFEQGCFLIFWGLFQKIFVADSLARIVDATFAGAPPYAGLEVLIAIYAFAFQILCDFAGYSNIARGLGKCMGFEIMVNFNLPYFATNPSEFWRRWHISLSTWLRDYLYIPLGGNRGGRLKTQRNLLLTMLLGGLWHGAAWTFLLWGVYHGLLLVVHRRLQPILARIPAPRSEAAARAWWVLRVVFFFHLVCLGWLLFRAQSVGQAVAMVEGLLFNVRLADLAVFAPMWWQLVAVVSILFAVQCLQHVRKNLLVVFEWPFLARWGFYTLLFHTLVLFGSPGGKAFIYFQF